MNTIGTSITASGDSRSSEWTCHGEPMKVLCTSNEHEEVANDLTVGGVYEVIGIEAGNYRILDDTGRPYLFEPEMFQVVDPSRPSHWVSEWDDGVEYAYAPELNEPGFFEDYFDHKPSARRAFHRYLNRHMRLTDAA